MAFCIHCSVLCSQDTAHHSHGHYSVLVDPDGMLVPMYCVMRIVSSDPIMPPTEPLTAPHPLGQRTRPLLPPAPIFAAGLPFLLLPLSQPSPQQQLQHSNVGGSLKPRQSHIPITHQLHVQSRRARNSKSPLVLVLCGVVWCAVVFFVYVPVSVCVCGSCHADGVCSCGVCWCCCPFHCAC